MVNYTHTFAMEGEKREKRERREEGPSEKGRGSLHTAFEGARRPWLAVFGTGQEDRIDRCCELQRHWNVLQTEQA